MTRGLAVGVTNRVAAHLFFTAEITDLCHGEYYGTLFLSLQEESVKRRQFSAFNSTFVVKY